MRRKSAITAPMIVTVRVANGVPSHDATTSIRTLQKIAGNSDAMPSPARVAARDRGLRCATAGPTFGMALVVAARI